ncbi:MAG: 3-hydroxyacyl-CoA dehydrogenase family protein [Deltaproteobacteria bacterium]|nr:3-hydroxyacyl-CoA dehydrogenase family protein [Candidatus Zymogenaceae bacterium]
MTFNKVLVVGSGVMGPGIALSFAQGGVDVALTDTDTHALSEGKRTIEEALELFEQQGFVDPADVPDVMKRIEFSRDLQSAAVGADLAVEAVTENPEIKEAVFRELDTLLSPEAVIGSNTSSFPVPQMYPDIRPGRLIIMHYFNPAHIMPLVEIVKTPDTPDDVISALRSFYAKIGKYVVVLNKFLPGFLVNRIQVAVMREALYLLEQGLAEPEEMDTAFKCCSALRGVVHGPLEHMDMVGLDTIAAASGVIFPLISNETQAPAILTEKVNAGKLGFKGDGGFYSYPEHIKEEHRKKRDRALLDELKLFRALVSRGDIMIRE